jgi:hypothetical protein
VGGGFSGVMPGTASLCFVPTLLLTRPKIKMQNLAAGGCLIQCRSYSIQKRHSVAFERDIPTERNERPDAILDPHPVILVLSSNQKTRHSEVVQELWPQPFCVWSWWINGWVGQWWRGRFR